MEDVPGASLGMTDRGITSKMSSLRKSIEGVLALCAGLVFLELEGEVCCDILLFLWEDLCFPGR